MKKLIDRYKYYLTTDILDLDLTILDIFILLFTGIWSIFFFFILPLCLIDTFFSLI